MERVEWRRNHDVLVVVHFVVAVTVGVQYMEPDQAELIPVQPGEVVECGVQCVTKILLVAVRTLEKCNRTYRKNVLEGCIWIFLLGLLSGFDFIIPFGLVVFRQGGEQRADGLLTCLVLAGGQCLVDLSLVFLRPQL